MINNIVRSISGRTVLTAEPEVPVKETLEWKTDVLTSRSGVEQRISLRRYPAVKFTYRFILADSQDWRNWNSYLYTYYKTHILVPLHHYAGSLKYEVPAGSTTITFDKAVMHLGKGDYALIIGEAGNAMTLVQSGEPFFRGMEAASGVEYDLKAGDRIIPCMECIPGDNPSLGMRSIDGELSLTFTAAENNSNLIPDIYIGTHVPTLGWAHILSRRPLALNTVADRYYGGLRIFDSGTGAVFSDSPLNYPRVFGKRQFRIDLEDESDLLWWFKFLDLLRGKQSKLVLSTYRRDMTLALDADPSVFRIHVEGRFYADLHSRENAEIYKGLHAVFEGEDVYLKVDYAQYDEVSGTTVLRLEEPPPALPEGSPLSILKVCRLNSDRVELEHYGRRIIITIDIGSVENEI